MDIITLTPENLENEHICCAISNNKDIQVSSKKSWLSERFAEGLTFKKCDVRGKCFIEYIPAENAWCPINASDYMFINCLWVSGQFKGKGYSTLLLNECLNDSKDAGKHGVCIISAQKKMPFLSDPKYLKYKGFVVADTTESYFELLYLPFSKDAPKPSFKSFAKNPKINEQGFILYYTHQCPFTAKYVPLIESIAAERNVPLKAIRIETAQDAQNAPTPFTTYSLFYNGEFLSNEILSDKKFEKLITEKGY